MSEERKKVLEMLAAGKITAEDAEKLLDKLESSSAESTAGGETGGEKRGAETKKPKYLRILVDSPGQEQVNVRVPLSFLRANAKLWEILPSRLSARLAEHGVGIAGIAGIAGLKGEDLKEALDELNVDIEKPNGKKVRIFCE